MIKNFIKKTGDEIEGEEEKAEQAYKNLRGFAKFKAFLKTKKGKWTTAIALTTLVVLLVGGYAVWNRYFKADVVETSLIKKVKKDKPKLSPASLDGTPVEEGLAHRHPLEIMVENHPDARPHTGLDKASIIYEAITEGGITRFMAVYGPQDADKVGPVRSARTFFVDWVNEYDGFYAHVGGSASGLQQIKDDGLKDLDQFGIGTKAFWREPQAGKATEHTMFTSTVKLYEQAKERGWNTGDDSFLEKWDFKEEAKAPERGVAGSTTVNFSSPTYQVKWNYDPVSNSYLRELAGSAHKDAKTGQQLAAKNVVVAEVEHSQVKDVWQMKTIGEGKATVYQDGRKIPGTWKKTSKKSRMKYFNQNGSEITFNPGQTWIEIVPPGTAVTE